MKKYIIITLLFILSSLLVFLFISEGSLKNGKLYISEVVSSNKSILKDDYNEYSDYIEIYNGYNYNISLKGYHLSDEEFNTNKYQLPDIEIKSHEYLIIYASNRNTCDLNTRVCHTNFKISSKGEVLTLSDVSGNIISKLTVPPLNNDESYSYNGRKYVITSPTPTKTNKKEEIKSKNAENYDLVINEYMTHNKRSVYDSLGNYYDWVEIYNNENKDVTLEGYYISDDEANLTKYEIPKVTVKAKNYFIIYFSGEVIESEEIHATFKLSDNDEYLILSNTNKVIDKVNIVKLQDNVSYGRVKNEWKYFATPTPLKENTTAYFDKWGEN